MTKEIKMFTSRLFILLMIAALMMITACAPSAAQSTSPTAPSAPIVATSPVLEPNTDPEAWSAGLLPNGVWQAMLTREDFVQRGVSRDVAEEEWVAVYTSTFQDGKAQLDFVGPTKTGAFTCLAEYTAFSDVVSFTFISSVLAGPCAGALDEVQSRLEDDGLHFHLVASSRGPLIEIQTTYEAKPFQKISDL